MRAVTPAPSLTTLDARIVTALAVAVAIALTALLGAVAVPRSASPALPIATPAATARSAPTVQTAGSAAPAATPMVTAEPAAAATDSPASPGAPLQPSESHSVPLQQDAPNAAAPRDGAGTYAPNGPAPVDQDGARQSTDDPQPAKIILPKGSLGQ